VRQRRGDEDLGLGPIVQATIGGEELERPLGPSPGRLGGRGLIPGPLGLAPQPVRCRAMALTRSPLAAAPVESLLGRLGAIQGAGGRAPGRPQRASPFAERVEDVERVVEVGQARGATAGALELHPSTQPGAVVADHGHQRRESGEFLGPGDAVARLDHPTRHPAQALGLDDHQDGPSAKKT